MVTGMKTDSVGFGIASHNSLCTMLAALSARGWGVLPPSFIFDIFPYGNIMKKKTFWVFKSAQ